MSQLPLVNIVESSRSNRIVELRSTTTVGRDRTNDIVLDELTVSRCHAVLFVQPEGIILIDLDSTNGTWVNGVLAPPDQAVSLTDGDTITLGRMVARYHAAATGVKALLTFSVLLTSTVPPWRVTIPRTICKPMPCR
jgi:pSer/pThr/pTyr-binding forkhead associated (FHA) protein